VSFGFEPDAFWDQTLETLSLCLEGKQAQFEREHNERAWLAWHAAALPLQKQFPKLESLMHKQKRQRRELTPDEMWALMVPITYTKN
jgi:hypothetical protein